MRGMGRVGSGGIWGQDWEGRYGAGEGCFGVGLGREVVRGVGDGGGVIAGWLG